MSATSGMPRPQPISHLLGPSAARRSAVAAEGTPPTQALRTQLSLRAIRDRPIESIQEECKSDTDEKAQAPPIVRSDLGPGRIGAPLAAAGSMTRASTPPPVAVSKLLIVSMSAAAVAFAMSLALAGSTSLATTSMSSVCATGEAEILDWISPGVTAVEPFRGEFGGAS